MEFGAGEYWRLDAKPPAPYRGQLRLVTRFSGSKSFVFSSANLVNGETRRRRENLYYYSPRRGTRCICGSVSASDFVSTLRQRQVQILDRFVDFRRALVPDRHARDARVLERELHGRLPVRALGEPALAHQFHADH